MRTFVASALLIALILVGQQWAVKSTEAARLGAPAAASTPTAVSAPEAVRPLMSWYAGS